MTRIKTCRRCGGPLAQRNNTGVCFRNCKPKLISAGAIINSPLVPGEERRMLISAVCEQFNVEQTELLNPHPKRQHNYTRARHVAYYLLVHDLGYTEVNAGKIMCRDGSSARSALDVINRDMDTYRADIEGARRRFQQRLELGKSKIYA